MSIIIKGQLYRLNEDRFDYGLVMTIKEVCKRIINLFAERINAEGKYIELHLSDSKSSANGIHYETVFNGISDGLWEDIDKWTCHLEDEYCMFILPS